MSGDRLCPEADERDAMSDSEFWERVGGNLLGYDPVADYEPDVPDRVEMAELHLSDPCPECGSRGACGWDEQGRPMIHATEAEVEWDAEDHR